MYDQNHVDLKRLKINIHDRNDVHFIFLLRLEIEYLNELPTKDTELLEAFLIF